MSTIGNWLQKNLVGTKGSGYDRTLDQQGEQIKNDINHIKDTVDTLTQPVEVSVEGSYKDLSTKDKLILGAAGGAVVGGGVGAMIGTFEAASDKPQVNVQWQEQHIMDVKVGYEKQNIPGTTEVATMDGLQKVTVDNASIRYHFSPEYTPTDKTYKVPGDITVDHDFTTNSVLGAAKGAAMGAVGGVALTGAYLALHKIKHKDDEKPAKPPADVKYGDETRTIIKTGIIGAGVGAVVGGVDAIMEQSRASGFSETVKWETPVMKNTMEVPRDASVMIRDDVQYSQDAFKDSRLYTDPAKFNLDKHMKGEKVTVDAQVPQKNLFGQYKMDEQTQTVDGVKARYGVVGNVFGGVVLGGVLGVASGVALNILKKMVNA